MSLADKHLLCARAICRKNQCATCWVGIRILIRQAFCVTNERINQIIESCFRIVLQTFNLINTFNGIFDIGDISKVNP
ncbi:hypothetical protein D3C72_1470180 [compost metagenome]